MMDNMIKPRVADATEFFTYQNPDDYEPKWADFYDDSAAKREALLRDIPHEVGLIYGDNPYQVANIYMPSKSTTDPSGAAPFIVYFHGGRWREGHPDFYDVLATPWVEEGVVFGSFGYRLEPDWSIEDSVEDCVLAAKWAVDNAHRFGADPSNIILAGHSAGSHLVSMVALTDWVEGSPAWLDSIRGVVCMSGPSILSDLIEDEPKSELLSPALRVSRTPQNVIVSQADPEPNKKGERPGLLTESSRSLIAALEAFGVSPTVVELGDADHLESAKAFSDRTSQLFIATHRMALSQGEGK